MRGKLTDLSVRALKPTERQFKVWDTTTPGFGVLVNGRSKSFIVMFGRDRRLKTLGRYPQLALSDARQLAKRFLLDPAPFKPPSPSLTDALAQYLSLQQWKHRTRYETELLLKKFAHLNHKALDAIQTNDLTEVTDKLKPSAARHAFKAIAAFFKWVVARRYLARSPLDGVDAPASTSSKERVLSDDELRRVWKAAEQIGYPFGTIVMLLILTGQRRGEIAALQASWIPDDKITLPGTVTKNGRDHTFPLPTLASTLIPKHTAGMLFRARGTMSSPFNGWSKSKLRLDKLSGVSDWTLHDLRRTFATNLAAVGVPIHVTEKILNHVSGSTGGIVGVYQKHQYWDEQVAAVNAWEDRLKAIIGAT